VSIKKEIITQLSRNYFKITGRRNEEPKSRVVRGDSCQWRRRIEKLQIKLLLLVPVSFDHRLVV
jgi:hypothetical protein